MLRRPPTSWQWKWFSSKVSGFSSRRGGSLRRKRSDSFLLIMRLYLLMESILSEKRRLHDTLLAFPPFYT